MALLIVASVSTAFANSVVGGTTTVAHTEQPQVQAEPQVKVAKTQKKHVFKGKHTKGKKVKKALEK